MFDAFRHDIQQVRQRARIAAGHLLMEGAMRSGVRLTEAEADYFRAALAEEDDYERAVQRRLNALLLPPGHRPAVSIRRIDPQEAPMT